LSEVSFPQMSRDHNLWQVLCWGFKTLVRSLLSPDSQVAALGPLPPQVLPTLSPSQSVSVLPMSCALVRPLIKLSQPLTGDLPFLNHFSPGCLPPSASLIAVDLNFTPLPSFFPRPVFLNEDSLFENICLYSLYFVPPFFLLFC